MCYCFRRAIRATRGNIRCIGMVQEAGGSLLLARQPVIRCRLFAGDCDFLAAAPLHLQVLSLAMTFYHRYFLTHKLAKSDPFIMAVACLHLAAKCCDRPRRISDVVEHLYRWAGTDLAAWCWPGMVCRHRWGSEGTAWGSTCPKMLALQLTACFHC